MPSSNREAFLLLITHYNKDQHLYVLSGYLERKKRRLTAVSDIHSHSIINTPYIIIVTTMLFI